MGFKNGDYLESILFIPSMGLRPQYLCDAPLGAIMPKRIQDLPEEYLSHQRALARALGARVRVRREELELTQEQLRARMELAQVFVSRTQYSRIENGEALPDAAELIALRMTLNVTFDWLLLGAG
jgi:ribosome-binding protein aMBF1 (putative translation factor)